MKGYGLQITSCRVLLVTLMLLLTACDAISDAFPTPLPPPTFTPMPTATTSIPPNSAAGFQQFLDQAQSLPLAERPAITSAYIAQLPQTPIVDGTTAIFIFAGGNVNVQLRGDMTQWGNGTQIAMEKINGTDFWWYRAAYEPDARLDYRFVVDGQERVDPRNPHFVPSGFGPSSELRMPDYVDPPELIDTTVYPAGELHEHTLSSDALNQIRSFFVYTPAGQLVGAKLPSLYVHDGTEALSLIQMQQLMDTLIGRKEIPPMVVVFIPPIDRQTEYDRNEAFANFVANEIVPFVQETYSTDPNPAKTTTMGASMGGLVSLFLGVRHPDTFGLIAGQSGAYSRGEDAILREIEMQPRLPLKLHLIIGTYETAIYPNPEGDFFAANQRLEEILTRKGYDFSYTEFAQGHSWRLWESQIGDALKYLYE